LNGETLEVFYRKDGICFPFCFGGHGEKIEISIPKRYTRGVAIKTISGDVEVESFSASSLDITTTSGDINVGNFSNLTILTTSGEIRTGKVGVATLKSVSGDVRMEGLTKGAQIATTSGSIRIQGATFSKDSNFRSVSGNIIVHETKGVFVETSTVSGRVRIDYNDRFSNTTLKIATTSGNITVD